MEIKRILKNIIMKFKNKTLTIGKKVTIGIKSEFEGYNKIGENSIFEGSLGRCSYIGNNCRISGDIGRYCSIASHVKTVGGTHPVNDWVSTHPVFYSTDKQCGITYVNQDKFDEKTEKAVLGNDVWIGSDVIIIDGVKIGDGVIVGAGSLVIHDIPPYAIVGGVPARIIRKRFNEKTILKLEEIKWWNKNEEWIINNADKFKCIDLFWEE